MCGDLREVGVSRWLRGMCECGLPVVRQMRSTDAVSYTHLRAHETVLDLVCRLLLEKKKKA